MLLLLCLQVLCEVEWALESLNLAVPERAVGDFFSNKENWNENPDTTAFLMQDWGVLSLYKTFLVDWHLIINRVSKKASCKSSESVSKRRNKPKVRTGGKSRLPIRHTDS
jgi:hypothetical protein